MRKAQTIYWNIAGSFKRGCRPVNLMPQILVEGKIFLIRGRRVMLDRDLAELYAVETRTLNQAVKRNINRFPEDFMFRLTAEEAAELSRSQFVTLKRGQNIKCHRFLCRRVYLNVAWNVFSVIPACPERMSSAP
ncbi:MAG: ORF6N domain-containing protein, partial [Nitrospirae bacterium]|nr:ORF6N domain-containing protein [Nitrospirota bacterium]